MKMKKFEDLLEEEDEKEDKVKKKKTQIVILILELILILGLGIFLMYIVGSTIDSMSKTTKKPKVTISTETSKTKMEKPLYVITPGYTYYVDKGQIKLYADVIPMSANKLFIIGELFHEEKSLDDSYIKESFSKQEDGTYTNYNNDIIVTYGDNTVTIEDKRRVPLQFDGSLELVEEAEHNVRGPYGTPEEWMTIYNKIA
jgi:hypothetical protein